MKNQHLNGGRFVKISATISATKPKFLPPFAKMWQKNHTNEQN